MTWSYTLPITVDKDRVRFLIGDTVSTDPLVADEEIDYSLTLYTDVKLAAALVLRALAARYTRDVNVSMGDISLSNVSDKAKGWLDLANEYDPLGLTVSAALVLPRFGGLTYSEKEAYSEDTDAVQPWFTRTMDNIPGGSDDIDENEYE